MKITLPLVFETVHALALALWLGADAALMILVSVGAAAAPHTVVVRELAVIEFSAIVAVGIQFLTRHRYKKSRTLYVADGVRHLLTFTALILAAYVMNSVKGKSIGVMESETIAYATAGGQIALLAAVSAISLWLLAASVSVAATAAQAASASRQTATEKPAHAPLRPIRKRIPKR
jgi:hypothetical protein